MNCYLLRVVQRKLRILPPCLQSLGLHEGVSHLLNLPRLRLRLHLLLSRALLLRSLFNPCHFHRSPSRCRLHFRLLVHRRLKLRTILHQMLCHLDPETDHLVHFNKLPPVPSPPECVDWFAVSYEIRHLMFSLVQTTYCCRCSFDYCST